MSETDGATPNMPAEHMAMLAGVRIGDSNDITAFLMEKALSESHLTALHAQSLLNEAADHARFVQAVYVNTVRHYDWDHRYQLAHASPEFPAPGWTDEIAAMRTRDQVIIPPWTETLDNLHADQALAEIDFQLWYDAVHRAVELRYLPQVDAAERQRRGMSVPGLEALEPDTLSSSIEIRPQDEQ